MLTSTSKRPSRGTACNSQVVTTTCASSWLGRYRYGLFLFRLLPLSLIAVGVPASAANSGTVVGNPLFTPGMFGNAPTFEFARYITLPDFSTALGSSYTEVLWVKRSSVPNGIEVLTAIGGTSSFQRSWVGIQVTGHLVFHSYGSAQLGSGVTVTDGAWHQVMLVYTPTTMTAYVDHNKGAL